jgi:putative DNA primase/helicase
MTEAADGTLLPEHRDYLLRFAITPEVLDASGVCSRNGGRPPGIIFPWRGPGAEDGVPQLRPDVPRRGRDGEPIKYESPKGAQLPFNRLRDDDPAGPVVVVEGTKQQYAVLSHAPEHYAVYGVAGCWAWSGLPLDWVEEREVYLLFDGDVTSNRHVYDGLSDLRDALERNGARSVHLVVTSALGKRGVDDELARLPQEKRGRFLDRWLTQASTVWPKAPSRTSSSPYFEKGSLLALKAAKAILAKQPAAITAERKIALYQDGVYRIDGSAMITATSALLEEQHRPASRAAIEEVMFGILHRAGKVLPERGAPGLLNLADGMLDLATGTLGPHGPEHLSSVQLPVCWGDGAALCPAYEAWLAAVCPAQVDDLEEVVSTMLDPGRTPAKALFAFGPSRSGKSTLLRILQAVAGLGNCSSVSLHQLVGNRFAAANVYGKILNAAADLSSAHVEDLSIFKMLTGEDLIMADRKYGGQFSFTNQALFAFSANELPTVGESSRAYMERIKPFEFPYSFAGHEDPAVEDAIMGELPGILVRWVAAWRRRNARGGYAETRPEVLQTFETRSDRVRQWLSERCEVTPAQAGSYLPAGKVASKIELYASFSAWAEEQKASAMGRQKFIGRLTSVNGVTEVRNEATKSRAVNVRIMADWEESGLDRQAEQAELELPCPYIKSLPIPVGEIKAGERSDGARNKDMGRVGPALPDLPALPDPKTDIMPDDPFGPPARVASPVVTRCDDFPWHD